MSSDAAIARCIFALLEQRAAQATICPSEVARALRPAGDWRALMPRVRAVAQGLADAGRLQITRGGRPVHALDPGGPLRLGRPPATGGR